MEMEGVEHVVLRGVSYEAVDAFVRKWIILPTGVPWSSLVERRPFFGTIPPGTLPIVEDAIVIGTGILAKEWPIRTCTNLQFLFETERPMYTYRHEGRLIFCTGCHHEESHERNLAIFSRLKDAWSEGRVLSVSKWGEGATIPTSVAFPFVEPFLSVLVVLL
jgi:hypothetical protein